MMEATEQPVIAVKHLDRQYGKKQALKDVTVNVARGQVFGLVGENGAGKTTLIKHLLGALTPQHGEVRVLGMDPVADPVGVLGRIGYLSEDRDLPMWMRVREFMRYTAAFFPDWDHDYAEQLRERFNLPEKNRIRTLSRGEKAKMGLLAALAHRPELLILDEPSSGLDAVARREILAAVVRSVAEEGRTVLFSSHLLDEVERVADHVVMIHQGEVVLSAPMDDLREQHRRFVVRFSEAQRVFPAIPGMLHAEGEGREWSVTCHGERNALLAALTHAQAEVLEETSPSLDAIFVARVNGGRQMQTEPEHANHG